MPNQARPRRRESADYYRDRRRRKVCNFCVDKVETIDYKEVNRLRRYLSERAKIEPRRKTGTCARHQRMLTVALKRARQPRVRDRAGEAAIADPMKFAVPIRARQSDFKLYLRIVRRFDHAGHAAKGRQFFVRTGDARRRRERSRRHGLRRRDRSVGQFQLGQSFARGGGDGAERQGNKRQSGQPLPIVFAP